jgi:hypothetical protein
VALYFSIERALWAASVLAELLLICRLFREGLVGRYPFFAAFLAADVICSLVLMQTDIKSRGYSQAFRICTLIMTLFRLGLAAEVYEHICKHFPGIGRFRVGMAAVLMLLATLLAVFTFRSNLVDQWAIPRTIVLVIQRYLGEIVAAVFALTWIFLRFVLSIRQPFQPNVWNHWRIATIYFGVSGAAHLVALSTGRTMAILLINSAMLAAQLVCFLAWCHVMRRSGEELPAFQRLSPDQVQTVEQYNRELLGTVRSLPGEISVRQAENRDTPLHRGRLR